MGRVNDAGASQTPASTSVFIERLKWSDPRESRLRFDATPAIRKKLAAQMALHRPRS